MIFIFLKLIIKKDVCIHSVRSTKIITTTLKLLHPNKQPKKSTLGGKNYEKWGFRQASQKKLSCKLDIVYENSQEEK